MSSISISLTLIPKLHLGPPPSLFKEGCKAQVTTGPHWLTRRNNWWLGSVSVTEEEVEEKPGPVSREEREQCGVLVDQSKADPEVQVTKGTFVS